MVISKLHVIYRIFDFSFFFFNKTLKIRKAVLFAFPASEEKAKNLEEDPTYSPSPCGVRGANGRKRRKEESARTPALRPHLAQTQRARCPRPGAAPAPPAPPRPALKPRRWARRGRWGAGASRGGARGVAAGQQAVRQEARSAGAACAGSASGGQCAGIWGAAR